MIYLLIILVAVWNGLVIRWRNDRNKKDSKLWHMLGRVLVIGIFFIGIMPFVSGWYQYVVNPFALLTPWHGAFLSLLIVFGLSYWIYDIIINWINNFVNGWDYHNSSKDRKFWRVELYVWAGLVVIWSIFGGMLENWVNLNTI